MAEGAEATVRGALDMQVCVPDKWGDKEVVAFAEGANPCGTTNGWHVRKEGDEHLQGAPERNPCARRKGYVHILLEA